ncbi:carboxymuconolactone decarboxylase family protein [Kiloniella laminariae]|uniref:Carboxymuconolactone decarboxylase family protein n=1 Tax=Kiloniella laminariae TaxID=454162 RepID=A0ABT4LDF7_9PROT|nr:carboxymuconolactone decarboxylase family protein [Kiloniella laminariae]MCZ4279138.1 carboxymuconolactone decarboxylase family protein [Kiloniella laminariae]
MNPLQAVKYEQEIPDILKSLASVHTVMDSHGFDRSLHHLVQLRASQMNRCAFCIKMHSKEAREDGETTTRLDRLIVWDKVTDFTPKERAALRWTEALTSMAHNVNLGELRAELREHFTEKEIGILTGTIAMINLWNRIQISRD